jgi:hypothetical protein
MSNWIDEEHNELSLLDKLRELLTQPYKLVLVQQHELERIRALRTKSRYKAYINFLHTHYIVEKKPKTYLMNEIE